MARNWLLAVMMAFVSSAVSADDLRIVLSQTLTFVQVNNLPIPTTVTMKCPAGYAYVNGNASFHFTNFSTARDAMSSGDYQGNLVLTDAGISTATGSPLGSVFVFRVPIQGNWDFVQLTVICEKVTDPNSVLYIRSLPVVMGNAPLTLFGATTCPAGKFAYGGFALVTGNITLDEFSGYGNLSADFFQLPAESGPPSSFVSSGTCKSGACQLDQGVICGTPPNSTFDIGLKGMAERVQPMQHESIKATVSPGSIATATVTCPAGTLATAGGYISDAGATTRLLSLDPTTPGTPYAARANGTYEAPNGWTVTAKNTGAAASRIGVSAICAKAASPSNSVVEFYNTTLKHYFRTAEPAEATAIDAGAAGPGWQRTGGNLDFKTYVVGSGPGNDVCRFYNPVANTHFFTADAAECAQVRLPESGWRYEGLAFRVQLPVGGVCPQGTIPVYRNYNNRFAFNDSNHRFTIDVAVYNAMIAQGWQGEGVVMCAIA